MDTKVGHVHYRAPTWDGEPYLKLVKEGTIDTKGKPFFYILRTPLPGGHQIKIGVSSSTKPHERLIDYERYFMGQFQVVEIRTFHKGR